MRLTVFEFCEGVVLPGVQGRPRVPATHREQQRLVVDLSDHALLSNNHSQVT